MTPKKQPEPKPEPKPDPVRMLGIAINNAEGLQREAGRWPGDRIHYPPPAVVISLDQARQLYEICLHARNIGAAVQHLEKN